MLFAVFAKFATDAQVKVPIDFRSGVRMWQGVVLLAGLRSRWDRASWPSLTSEEWGLLASCRFFYKSQLSGFELKPVFKQVNSTLQTTCCESTKSSHPFGWRIKSLNLAQLEQPKLLRS